MRTHNNVILLTGATSGIGYELLKQFHACGNTLLVTSRSGQRLELLSAEFTNIHTMVCDLSIPEDVNTLISKCKSEFPNLNMLINNAGIQFNYDWLDETNATQKINDEIQINLTSPAQLICSLLPGLLKQSNSCIINISSGLAFAPKQSAPIYCASKAAIHSLSKSIRYQLEQTPVRVFEIIPPLVDTAMTAGRGKGKISPKQLVGEFIKNFKHNHYEINIGKTKWLRRIQRLSPKLADRILRG